ncbi:MAG: pantoate--beta-alanine ligase [Planctomycetota bacterium]|jgi:pantoate--beta-alanine ligase
MEVIKKLSEMQTRVSSIKEKNETIGFVPTMGALHEGHISLMRNARAENNKLIISIFVNPTQFDSRDDFKSYPRRLDKDIEISESEKVDIVFAPNAEELYDEKFCTYVLQTKLTEPLCGKFRPGHFKGVITVITKLFNIVKPDRAYLGQKDYQQNIIIKRLVRDLNMTIDIKILPTARDKDGLAFSSRNKHLNPQEHSNALCIYNALLKAKTMYSSRVKDANKIIEEMTSIIKSEKSTKIDYVSIVNPNTLEDVSRINGKAVAAVAVRVGDTRLIDNIILE